MVDNDQSETNCVSSCDDSLNDFEESDEGVLSASNSESSSGSNKSERDRAYTTRKHLPKDPELRCCTIMRLFLHALVKPETKAIMASEMSQSEQVRKAVKSIEDSVSQESKEVHKFMRQLYALQSKGAKKSAVLSKKIKQKKKQVQYAQDLS